MNNSNPEITSTAAEIWSRVCVILKQNLNEKVFDNIFRPIQAISYKWPSLVLLVPSQYFVDTIEHHYLRELSVAMRSIIGKEADLTYKVAISDEIVITETGTVSSDRKLPDGAAAIEVEIQKTRLFGKKHVTLDLDPQLNENFNFKNYVVGDSNKVAYTLAQSVSRNPGKTPSNPLFVYGKSGCGKTHLIQAIGCEVKNSMPDSNVIYLSTSRFCSQFTQAVANKMVAPFMAFYQLIDVLIIDDIQELSGKKGTEGVFFQIFDFLQQSGKQIVIAADKKPADILGLEERLLSRLKMGGSIEIKVPDYETRVRIVKNKIAHDGIVLSEDVIDYLATNINTNVRELEGAIISLLALATIEHSEIDIGVAKGVVGSIVRNPITDLSVESIIEMVADHYNTKVSDIIGTSRKHEVVLPRQVAMYLAKRYSGESLASIGQSFGNRNHSTVVYTAQLISDKMSVDPEVKKAVEFLERKIKQV